MNKLVRIVSHVDSQTNAEIDRKVAENPRISKSAIIAIALAEKFPTQKPVRKAAK